MDLAILYEKHRQYWQIDEVPVIFRQSDGTGDMFRQSDGKFFKSLGNPCIAIAEKILYSKYSSKRKQQIKQIKQIKKFSGGHTNVKFIM